MPQKSCCFDNSTTFLANDENDVFLLRANPKQGHIYDQEHKAYKS